jgi:hemolysin activation/secretion protein
MRINSLSSCALCLLFAGSFAPATAFAHDNSAKTDPQTVVVSSLKGLVFVSKPDAIQKSGVSEAGIKIENLEVLANSEFQSQLQGYLGQPLTLAKLNEITRLTIKTYRSRNRPVVDVVVPEQNVQSGTVQILVTEFLVGKVSVQGNRWFSSRLIAAPITLQHGDVIDSTELVSQLDAANTNPFRQVNLLYQPSSEPGYTDLVLKSDDRFPVRVYTGFDNSGTPATGLSRSSIGFNWGNAFWSDQQLSYQFTASDDFFASSLRPAGHAHAGFIGHSLTWTAPLSWGDSISISGGFQLSAPNVGQDFGIVGKSGQASFRYNKNLPRTAHFLQVISAGYDFKTTNNNLAFGGDTVSRDTAEIDQFPVEYSVNYTDRLGTSSLITNLVYSPGGITPNNNTGAFQPAPGQSGRALASAEYIYWRTDITRLTKLPKSAVWSSRLIGQASSRNLLYTEQLGASGPDMLRGYDTNAILGDQGVVLSNELRSANFRNKEAANLGQVQFLAFCDYAHVFSKDFVATDVNKQNASSVGVRYNLRSNLTARFDYGWQLIHLPNSDSKDQLATFAIALGN